MSKKQGGPLQRTGVHMTKEDGDALKKSTDAVKALLDSVGSSTSDNKPKAAEYHRISPRYR